LRGGAGGDFSAMDSSTVVVRLKIGAESLIIPG
jgi:hypothetical protein